MYINSVHDDVRNMKNVESGPLRHSQELKLTQKILKINDTKYDKAHARCMLYNFVYKLKLCNSYCLSSAKMDVLTCLKYYFGGMLPIFLERGTCI